MYQKRIIADIISARVFGEQQPVEKWPAIEKAASA